MEATTPFTQMSGASRATLRARPAASAASTTSELIAPWPSMKCEHRSVTVSRIERPRVWIDDEIAARAFRCPDRTRCDDVAAQGALKVDAIALRIPGRLIEWHLIQHKRMFEIGALHSILNGRMDGDSGPEPA